MPPFIPPPQQAKKYISRLEAVQTAIDDNLTQLAKNSPELRVGLITFNREVKLIGDGHHQATVIAGEQLYSPEEIRVLAQTAPTFEPVGRNKDKLRDEVLK